MKRRPEIRVVLLLAVLSLTLVTGCVDGIRQAMVPGVFSGIQTIADGLISGADPNSLTNGAQAITDGVIAGLKHSVYPEG